MQKPLEHESADWCCPASTAQQCMMLAKCQASTQLCYMTDHDDTLENSHAISQ